MKNERNALKKMKNTFLVFYSDKIPHRLYALNNIISMCTDNEDIKTNTVSCHSPTAGVGNRRVN